MKIHVEVVWVVTRCKCCGRIPTFRRALLPPFSGF